MISNKKWYVGTDQRLYTILPNIIAIGLHAEHAGWYANHQDRCDVSGLMTVYNIASQCILQYLGLDSNRFFTQQSALSTW